MDGCSLNNGTNSSSSLNADWIIQIQRTHINIKLLFIHLLSLKIICNQRKSKLNSNQFRLHCSFKSKSIQNAAQKKEKKEWDPNVTTLNGSLYKIKMKRMNIQLLTRKLFPFLWSARPSDNLDTIFFMRKMFYWKI